MPNGYPCPNPACDHVFLPESVKGAAALNCPRCGTVFQFRAGPASAPARPGAVTSPPASAKRAVPPAIRPAAAAPARPPAKAAPVKPPAAPEADVDILPVAAAPVAPAVPLATPVYPAEGHEALAPPPDFTPPRLKRRTDRRIGRLVLALVGGLILLPVVVGGCVALLFAGLGGQALSWLTTVSDSEGGGTDPGKVHESSMYNYRFQFPARPWRLDQRLEQDMHTGVAMRRADPNAWLAIITVDYKERMPQDADLIDEAVRRLRGYFKDHFEWEQKPDTELAGLRAPKLEFVSESNHVELTGECTMLAYKGIGYWFVTWAPSDVHDVVADEWEADRKGFVLLREREGWKGTQPKLLTLTGSKGDYALGYTEGLWADQDDPKAYDPDADKALLGRDQTEPKDADKTATAVVLVLPRQPDLKAAVAAARAHVETQEKKLVPDAVVEDAEKTDADDRPPDEIGSARGQVVKLQVRNSEGFEHFVYLAVVPQGEQVLAIQCECDGKRRTYWEVNFVQLLRKFRLKR
jgi:hypothetical protein